jgi:DNA polymerase-3 subunit gamma/tau
MAPRNARDDESRAFLFWSRDVRRTRMTRMAKRKPTAEAADSAAAPAPADYTVLARRYRPQQFSDLVGQEAVAQALANAIESGRVAHAYLFTGARGVGKTSTARILAKALNCVNGPTPTPCGECEICKAIATGEDLDVLEIDGASNNSVDDVRELRQNAQYRPSRARYRIYIIDEVHMLAASAQKSAFNALLKTLEEPPPHVKFIFATTEVQKIPATILSRCQRFDFGGISVPRIVDRLRQIVAAEKAEADDAALELLARRAGGSMRDAQSLLDQLLAFSGERLTTETVHRLLGTANEDRVAAVAKAVLAKDAKQALEVLAGLVNDGQQLGELLDQLVDYWRDLMVVRCAGVEGQDLSVTGKHRDALAQQADAQALDTILAGLDLLVGAKARLRLTSHARVVLEITLVRLTQLDELVPLSQLVQWVSQNGSAPATTKGTTGTNAARTTAPPVGPGVEKKKLTDEGDVASGAATLDLTSENLTAIWQQVISEAGFALASDLRKATPVAISGPNVLAIRVSEQYNSSGPGGFDPSRWLRAEPLLSRITGRPCAIRVEVVRDQPAEPPLPSGGMRQVRERVRQIPQVQKARDLLAAEILHVDPGFGEIAAPIAELDDTAADAGDEE